MTGIIRTLIVVVFALAIVRCGGEGSNGSGGEAVKTALDTAVRPSEYSFLNELEDPDRNSWQMPDTVLAKFGKIGDKQIADIGAGPGYFSLRLAARGAGVIAIDIDENFLQHIDEEAIKLPAASAGRIETRLTVSEHPSLAEAEVDGALIVNTAYFLPNRTAYFKDIFVGLKKGGLIVIVDFKAERSPVAPPDNLWISSAKLVTELKAAGFVVKEVDTKSLPYQYIITAIKK